MRLLGFWTTLERPWIFVGTATPALAALDETAAPRPRIVFFTADWLLPCSFTRPRIETGFACIAFNASDSAPVRWLLAFFRAAATGVRRDASRGRARDAPGVRLRVAFGALAPSVR
jgi:hypothetical protein